MGLMKGGPMPSRPLPLSPWQAAQIALNAVRPICSDGVKLTGTLMPVTIGSP